MIDKTSKDKKIIDDYLRGNPDAFQTVDQWIKNVVKSRMWVGSISPSDITGDTHEKLLHNFRSKEFRFDSSLKTYVQKITRYTVIDTVRSFHRAQKYVAILQLESQPNQSLSPPFENEEQLYIVDRLLTLIGKECKKLWMMIFYEELNYREIATKLEISEGAVKTRAYRCKEQAIGLQNRSLGNLPHPKNDNESEQALLYHSKKK